MVIPFPKVKNGLEELAGGPEPVAMARDAGAFAVPTGPQFQPWYQLLPDSLLLLITIAVPSAFFAGKGRDELIDEYRAMLEQQGEPTRQNPLVSRSMARTRRYRRFLRLLRETGQVMPRSAEEALDLLIGWGLLQQYTRGGKLIIDYALPWPDPAKVFPSLAAETATS